MKFYWQKIVYESKIFYGICNWHKGFLGKKLKIRNQEKFQYADSFSLVECREKDTSKLTVLFIHKNNFYNNVIFYIELFQLFLLCNQISKLQKIKIPFTLHHHENSTQKRDSANCL